MLTWSLFLVTLKKSSMRDCLLRPAALSFSLSSRLLSRIWRYFSIRRRTLSSLKTYQHEYSQSCIWTRRRSMWNEGWAQAKIQYVLNPFDVTEEPNQGFFIWLSPGEFRSYCLWCIQEYLPGFFVLPEMWHRMGLKGSKYLLDLF